MTAVGVGPSLAVRQRRGAGFDFVGPGLPVGATLARASAGWCIDASGVLTMKAADQPRFDSDPVTRGPRGLLIEPAASNVLPASEDMVSGSGWAAGIASYWTASASTGVGTPAGAGSALKLVANGTGETVLAVRKVGLSFSGTVTVSTYVYVPRQAGVTSWAMRNDAQDMEGGEVAFAATFDRWVRVACVITAAGSRSFLDYNLAFNGQYAAPAGATVYLAKPQLESGGIATSHVPTGASPVARAADLLTLDWKSRGVGDGVRTVRYGFDDGSSQDVATTISGGVASVPTDLRRARLIRATLG